MFPFFNGLILRNYPYLLRGQRVISTYLLRMCSRICFSINAENLQSLQPLKKPLQINIATYIHKIQRSGVMVYIYCVNL